MTKCKPIKLTIAVPTYNRGADLSTLLSDLTDFALEPDCEILIIDNASTDFTPQVLSEYVSRPGFRILRNDFNLGIEGNIIRVMTLASGEYVWLLSDHMRINRQGVNSMIEFLREDIPISVGYARIADYGSIIKPGVPYLLENLTRIQRSRLLFYTSNISGLVVRAEMVRKAIRQVFRMARYTYPHMGIYFYLVKSDKVIEFQECSSFQKNDKKNHTRNYDTFKSRFIEYPLLLSELRESNAEMDCTGYEIYINEYKSAMRHEILRRLLLHEVGFDFSELRACLLIYRGFYRHFFMALWIFSQAPVGFRRFSVRLFIRLFFPAKRSYVEISDE